MSKKMFRRSMLLFIVVLGALLLLAGCGGNKSDNNEGTASNATNNATEGNESNNTVEDVTAEPVKFSILRPFWGEVPDENSAIYKKHEEIMNAEITSIFVQGP